MNASLPYKVEKKNNTIIISVDDPSPGQEIINAIHKNAVEVWLEQSSKFCALFDFRCVKEVTPDRCLTLAGMIMDCLNKCEAVNDKFLIGAAVVCQQDMVNVLNIIASAVLKDERVVVCQNQRDAIKELQDRWTSAV